MVDVSPARWLRAVPGAAAALVSPPYDVSDEATAAVMTRHRATSFLRVTRPDLTGNQKDPSVVLNELVSSGALVRQPTASYVVWRMSRDGIDQTGILGAVSLRDVADGRVRRHEATRPIGVTDRLAHFMAVRAFDEPVYLLTDGGAHLTVVLDEAAASSPDLDVTAVDGVRHRLWSVDAPNAVAAVAAYFGREDALWVADGHHRVAAAAAVHAELAESGDLGDHGRIPALVMPVDQARVEPYHRLVADLGEHDRPSLLAALASVGRVTAAGTVVLPSRPATFGVRTVDGWWQLDLLGDLPDDPVAGLDVALLQDRVLRPLLGVVDPRTDLRLSFVGGRAAVQVIDSRLASGAAAVAFTVAPTPLASLRDVADAGRVMPPKSTWFEPKPASGLLLLPF